MREARLALRLVRGAGGRDVAVLVATTLGIALTVFCLVLAGSVPFIVLSGRAVEAARLPQSADMGSRILGPRVARSTELVDGHVVTKFVWQGVGAEAPLPPGLDAWPSPGHSVVSPALAALLRTDEPGAEQSALGTVDARVLGSSGLTDPDEMVSYTVIPGAPVSGGVAGFGAPADGTMETPQSMVIAETGLLVGLPALVFLALCLRATARDRAARYRSLVVMGVSPTRCASLYAHEITIVAFVGLVIGVAGYIGGQGTLGLSGLLGIRWWPRDGALGAGSLLAVLGVGAGTLVGVRIVAAHAMRVTLSRPRRRDPHPTWWTRLAATSRFLAATGFLLALGYLAFVCATARTGVVHATGTSFYTRTLAVVAIAALTAIPTASLISRAAVRLATRSSLTSVRHAAARAAFHRRSIGRLGAVVVALLLVGGMGNAFVTWVQVVTAYDRPVRDVQADLDGGSVQARHSLRAALQTANLHVAAESDSLFLRAERCDGRPARRGPLSRLVDASVRVPTLAGPPRHIDVHRLPHDAALFDDQVVLCHDRDPWLWEARAITLVTTVPVAGPEYRRVLALLHRLAPMAEIRAFGGRTADNLAREQALLLRTGLVACFALTAAGCLLVMSDIKASTRRAANALVAAGAPVRFLRSVHAASILIMLAPACVLGALTAVLCCWGMLAMYGREQLTSDVLTWTLLPAAVICLLIGAWGWADGRHRFSRTLLAPPREGVGN